MPLPPELRQAHLTGLSAAAQVVIRAGNQQALFQFVGHHLTQEPPPTDVLHDLLQQLAADMLALTQQQQAGNETFLAWLSQMAGCNWTRFSGKTRLRHFSGNQRKGYAPLAGADLLAILQQNRSRLKWAEPDWQAQLQQTYAIALEQLLPIYQQINQTDRVIEAIVDRLYGVGDKTSLWPD